MKQELAFEKYGEGKDALALVLELFIHVLLPLIAEIIIDLLVLPHLNLNLYVEIIILIGVILLTFCFSIFVISPLITRVKFNKLYKLNNYLKNNDIFSIRSEFLTEETKYLKPHMSKIRIKNYTFIKEEIKKFPNHQKLVASENHFIISKLNGKIIEWVIKTEWGGADLKGYSLEIDKTNNILMIKFSFVYNLSSESILDTNIKNLHLQNGYGQILFDYKNDEVISSYFFDNLEDPSGSSASVVIYNRKIIEEVEHE